MLSFIGFLICAILVFYVIRGISDLSNTASESRKLKKTSSVGSQYTAMRSKEKCVVIFNSDPLVWIKKLEPMYRASVIYKDNKYFIKVFIPNEFILIDPEKHVIVEMEDGTQEISLYEEFNKNYTIIT